ncbi:hypothetical protein ROZALSC1DRAFT_22461 [Rozella allomycis CSF55]|uniref:COPI associated protein n=1 Tax=Rozella allomycis (strain CSF55) TaxID=988480 RepID=A0A4P9YL66_ROZAC|nr:hypothetical protein ROZALSC1DRAFT_22461 [Rozella allomycis CSF55]
MALARQHPCTTPLDKRIKMAKINLGHLFHFLNFVVSILTAYCGVMFVLNFTFRDVILGVIFGALLFVSDLKGISAIKSQLAFLSNMLGRGLTYLFLGCFVLGSQGYSLIVGAVILAIAFLTIICSFIAGFDAYPEPII